jgi:hypothetical protein
MEQQGAVYAAAEAALEREDFAAAADQFASLAAAQSGDAAALSSLREAEARVAAGERNAGLVLLDTLAEDARIDAVLRDYAAVTAAMHRLGQADPVTVQANLRQQMAADAPFRHSAQELAALAALEAGDEPGAIDMLRQLQADTGTPEAMRSRTAELLAALGVLDEEADSATPPTDEAS